MSRLGKQPVILPAGVEATFEGGILTVKKGNTSLSREIKDDVELKMEGDTITFSPKEGSVVAKALWGTYAAHARNMVTGVTEGFKKVLEIEGVGYRAEVKGNKLVLLMGFSHPVEKEIPEGVNVVVEKGVVTVTGVDKEAIGQFAADVRKVKKPEPYKGKGIRYQGEYIIRKQGKKAV
ncbi:50S ribosomal protein L6 [Candidatus Kaiserbacteria bacterium CG10_big_fil_rev_8_21_14_0_10_44_10]|uniref:Large ribosomal subunit protein uL6 n=1 Tax=Candidatus Kaiserbacteria bacterium CG10_big_fil_rev_8_21_14_0_10_44_10 TaxID=1974606 RepID=A0A2H0UH30_9BACT|nr:MAG: 50S ribosomal protein L6 [Candidatus Kaiserbacteria bacterium CG10_big_fil_rev_8_21_14_0_10_44_10]